MTEIIYDKKRILELKAAILIKESIINLLKKQKYVILAIPGGRSVKGIFKNLLKQDIPWKKVHIFMVDERMVPITDKNSNFKLANDSFIKELVNKKFLTNKNLHPFNISIQDYIKELKSISKQYDIVLLSSGEDGHIGAIYPNHHSLDDNASFFIEIDDSPKFPKDRRTMSKKLLLKSKTVILLFFGKSKKNAYRKFVDDTFSIYDCPAKLIQNIKDSYVLTNVETKDEKHSVQY